MASREACKAWTMAVVVLSACEMAQVAELRWAPKLRLTDVVAAVVIAAVVVVAAV